MRSVWKLNNQIFSLAPSTLKGFIWRDQLGQFRYVYNGLRIFRIRLRPCMTRTNTSMYYPRLFFKNPVKRRRRK